MEEEGGGVSLAFPLEAAFLFLEFSIVGDLKLEFSPPGICSDNEDSALESPISPLSGDEDLDNLLNFLSEFTPNSIPLLLLLLICVPKFPLGRKLENLAALSAKAGSAAS